MEKMVRFAKGIALETGYHAPMLLLDGVEKKAPMLLGNYPEEHEQKIMYMYFAGKNFSEKGKIGKLNKVFFVIEAWMGTNINVQPSRDAKRIEVLIVTCLDILTNEQKVASLEYVRDASGKLIDIKDNTVPDGVTAESPLLPAFVAGYNDSTI